MKKLDKKFIKLIPALIAVLIIGIMMVIPWGNKGKEKVDFTENPSLNSSAEEKDELTIREEQLEKRLEEILKKIDGVEDVDVSLIFSTGPKYDYALNVTTNTKSIDEKDEGGGARNTTEKTEDGEIVVLRSNDNGHEKPVITKEYKPEIQGVLVVAEGADQPQIKNILVSSVQTVLGIESHKIDVQPKNRGN